MFPLLTGTTFCQWLYASHSWLGPVTVRKALKNDWPATGLFKRKMLADWNIWFDIWSSVYLSKLWFHQLKSLSEEIFKKIDQNRRLRRSERQYKSLLYINSAPKYFERVGPGLSPSWIGALQSLVRAVRVGVGLQLNRPPGTAGEPWQEHALPRRSWFCRNVILLRSA